MVAGRGPLMLQNKIQTARFRFLPDIAVLGTGLADI